MPKLPKSLVVMLWLVLTLPFGFLRLSVLGISLAIIVISSLQANSPLARARLPLPLVAILGWAVIGSVWHTPSADSVIMLVELAMTLVVTLYICSTLTMTQIHAASLWGAKLFVAFSAAIGLAVHFGQLAIFDRYQLDQGLQAGTSNPNLLAFSSVMSLVAIVTYRSEGKRALTLKVGWVIGALALVVLSKSGGGAVFAVGALLVAYSLRGIPTGQGVVGRPLVLAIGGTLALLSGTVRDKFLSLIGVADNVTLSGRTEVWAAVASAIMEFPFFGVSAESLSNIGQAPTPGIASVWSGLEFEAFGAHNGYLDVALRLGIPALLLLVVGLITSLRRLAFAPPSHGMYWCASTLVTLMLYNLTEARFISPSQAWFLVALACSSALSLRSGIEAVADRHHQPARDCRRASLNP